MIIDELVKAHADSIEEIENKIIELYPFKEKYVHEGKYRKVFEELLQMRPSKVYFVANVVKEKDKKGRYIHKIYAKRYHSQKNKVQVDDQDYALRLLMWNEFLGVEIDEATLVNYDPLEIIACCLYEMTFFGFELKDIQEKNKELINQIKKVCGPNCDINELTIYLPSDDEDNS